MFSPRTLADSRAVQSNDAINDDFLSVNVCGMDNFSLLAGRPFGGCSILYRKTLSLTVSPLSLSSNRLCAI